MLGCAVEIFVVIDTKLLFFTRDEALSDVRVGSLETKYHGLGEFVLLVCSDDRLSKLIASEDTSKDVDENSFDFSVVV